MPIREGSWSGANYRQNNVSAGLPAGLVQVETVPDKTRAAARVVEEPVPVEPRVRPPLAPDSTEPLLQVETRKREAEVHA